MLAARKRCTKLSRASCSRARLHTLAIVSLSGFLLSAVSGCQLLGIPSYQGPLSVGHDEFISEPIRESDWMEGQVVGAEDHWGHPAHLSMRQCDPCPPGIIPPIQLPWIERWKKHDELPDAPAYPRFQPLPTRPVFEAKTQASMIQPGRGVSGEYREPGTSSQVLPPVSIPGVE